MVAREHRFINQEFESSSVSPAELDAILAGGWRHFGTRFFRYSYAFYGLEIRGVVPLRIRLDRFSPSKSQRRILNKNRELDTFIRPTNITPDSEKLFLAHRRRFSSGAPDSLYDFLSEHPAIIPCQGMEASVYFEQRLVAVSYFDLGETSCSGIYAMFDPAEASRSLGIFTMLKEIEYAINSGSQFYYQGYSYEGSSFYDYKKRFNGSEAFDWAGDWHEFKPQAPVHRAETEA